MNGVSVDGRSHAQIVQLIQTVSEYYLYSIDYLSEHTSTVSVVFKGRNDVVNSRVVGYCQMREQ